MNNQDPIIKLASLIEFKLTRKLLELIIHPKLVELFYKL